MVVDDLADKLTPRVLQIAEMLGLYGAELARILHLQCADISKMVAAKKLITRDMVAWPRAILFIEFYQALHSLMQGNDVLIYHWLRANNPELNGIPLLLMVDDDKLGAVTDFVRKELEQSAHVNTNEQF